MSDRAFERFIVWAILVVALIGATAGAVKMFKGTILVNLKGYEVELVVNCATFTGVLAQMIEAQALEGWKSMVVKIAKGGKDVDNTNV